MILPVTDDTPTVLNSHLFFFRGGPIVDTFVLIPLPTPSRTGRPHISYMLAIRMLYGPSWLEGWPYQARETRGRIAKKAGKKTKLIGESQKQNLVGHITEPTLSFWEMVLSCSTSSLQSLLPWKRWCFSLTPMVDGDVSRTFFVPVVFATGLWNLLSYLGRHRGKRL